MNSEDKKMKKSQLLLVLIFLCAIPGLASNKEVNGTFEKVGTDRYKITVYLPTSQYSITILETNYTIENSMSTNVVNFTVTQNELDQLKQSFTITVDSNTNYHVMLEEKLYSNNSELTTIEFLISFILGGVFLFILYKTLTRQFKETNNS